MARLIQPGSASRIESRVRFVEDKAEERTQSRQTGGINPNSQFDEVPDRVAVAVGVIWSCEEAGKEDLFDDGGCAG